MSAYPIEQHSALLESRRLREPFLGVSIEARNPPQSKV